MRNRTLVLILSSPLLCFVFACSSSSSSGASDATVDATNPDALVEAAKQPDVFQHEATVPDSTPPVYDVQPVPTCTGGRTYCAAAFGCVDLTSSTAYCGSCTTGCPATEVCANSKCGCPAGTTLGDDGLCVCPTGSALENGVCVDAGRPVDSGTDARSGDAQEDGHTADAQEDGHTADAQEDGHTADAKAD